MAEEVQGQQSTNVTTTETLNFLDSVIQETGMVPQGRDTTHARDLIAEVARQVLEGEISVDRNLDLSIKDCIAQLDDLISDQLNEVMHNPEFQKLEGSWRGLHQLVHGTETSETLKIRVLNVSKKDLLKDLQNAPEFDQSALFKQVYEAEYGTLGGTPYGLLLGDYEFGNQAQDVSLLERISNVAAQAHAPFVAAVAPEMFNLESFTDLATPRDLAKIFESPEYVQWRSFRDSEDSRYVALTLPHYLGRLPYGEKGLTIDEFKYDEKVDGKDHNKYLWCNSAYQFGLRLTDAFAQFGWCARIRGVEGGGKVEGLPAHTFKTDSGEIALKEPTEVAITDRREKELEKLGFVSLVHNKGADYAAFLSGATANKPKKFQDDEASANADLSSKLPNIMATSRIAHYLKTIVRDKIGSFTSRSQIEIFLNSWLKQYVILDDNADDKVKARKPLRNAKVVVEDVPGQPGVYQARAHLQPHYQLEGVNVSLRLVAKLPAGK